MFKRLSVKEWRQFSEIDITFHPHLTVLTGANGAGKTTILNLISRNFGWDSKFVSSYAKDEKTGVLKYLNSLKRTVRNFIRNDVEQIYPNMNKIGEIQYKDNTIAELLLPQLVNETYSVEIVQAKPVKGVYINSHRPIFPYRAVRSIPTQIVNRNQIYQKYYEFNKTFVFDTYRNVQEVSATGLIKETLASLATFGYGNKAVSANENAKELFEGYEKILKIVLPPKLGFENIQVLVPEVLLCTKTGNFPLDAVSGGISSIIDITWQLFMFADQEEEFVTIIDEPENHLHPELQKSFLTNLITAFPHVQFIIATHNPFMISAQKDSCVYVFDYDDNNKVHSIQLDYINRAGTSNAILREVLGIESTMPYWAETLLNDTVQKYSNMQFSSESLQSLRDDLKKIGLGDYIPESIAKVVEAIKK